MKDEVKELITAIGAAAEMCGELYKRLIDNGFTEAQALNLVGKFLTSILATNNNKEEQ